MNYKVRMQAELVDLFTNSSKHITLTVNGSQAARESSHDTCALVIRVASFTHVSCLT
jgi:uncharacterized protein YdiU (UPF0061 family)